jgi:hypothetical protein
MMGLRSLSGNRKYSPAEWAMIWERSDIYNLRDAGSSRRIIQSDAFRRLAWHRLPGTLPFSRAVYLMPKSSRTVRKWINSINAAFALCMPGTTPGMRLSD